MKFNFIIYKRVVMPDKYTRLKKKFELKISQLKIAFNSRINKLKRENNAKTNTIIRLNNIIRELKRKNQNLPVAMVVN